MDERNLVLIGFMGCGKTTIGKALAQRLKWEFIDTDELIEKQQGCTIRQIFVQKGEEAFRQIERESICAMSLKNHQIIATGGGVAKDPVNIRNLKQNGCIIYLRLKAESLYERVKDDDTRPLLQPYTGIEKLQRIRQLLIERQPMYESSCDQILDCDDMTIEEILDKILKN